MGKPPDQQQVRSLVREGLRQLRAGKVSAAIKSWEEVLTLEEGHEGAKSFIEYIKKNRIRIAVHLGRTPPQDNEPIEVPESWPEPPPGLCDPVPGPEADEDAPAEQEQTPPEVDDGSAADQGVMTSSGHLPYAEVELVGSSRPRLSDVLKEGAKAPAAAPPAKSSPKAAPKAPPAPRPPVDEGEAGSTKRRPTPTRSPTGDDYLVMEIEVEDDDAPPADPRTLPPPPEALDAPPEMIIEAPKQESNNEEQQDYLYDRASSEQLEGLSLDRLAGKGESTDSTAPPPPTSSAPPEAPSAHSDHAPSQTGDQAPPGADAPAPGPPAQTGEEVSREKPQTPRVATTFDEVATNPRADPEAFSRKPPGGMGDMSPYTTLAGLGPRVLFAEFGDKDLQGEAPPLDFAPPPGEDAAPGAPGTAPPDDYVREQGSFSEDAPTRALDSGAKAPGVHMDAPADFDREEGSFSDEIPTRARPSSVQVGSGVVADPGEFRQEASFSDDIPTMSRTTTRESEAGIRAMPLDQDFQQEGSFSDDLVTRERDGEQKQEGLSEEIEALLHPDRGLALAQKLFDDGEFARSLELVEQLQSRYPTLQGIADLLDANRGALEASILESLGDLASIPVPKTSDIAMDNKALDPRAAFLFSRIDGTLSLQDIMDISGMTQFEAARILLRLRDIGMLEFESPR